MHELHSSLYLWILRPQDDREAEIGPWWGCESGAVGLCLKTARNWPPVVRCTFKVGPKGLNLHRLVCCEHTRATDAWLAPCENLGSWSRHCKFQYKTMAIVGKC